MWGAIHTQPTSSKEKVIEMAGNVFGEAITTETLKKMPKYAGKPITPINKAKEAFIMIYDGDKNLKARKFVEDLKLQYGDGVTTLCVLYNATGGAVRFIGNNDENGHLWKSPYPMVLQNGQWGAFLHVETQGEMTGSSALVIYRGKNQKKEERDYMLMWSNPGSRSNCVRGREVYTEVRKADEFKSGSDGKISTTKPEKSALVHTVKSGGCESMVSIGDDTTSIFEAILTLVDAENHTCPNCGQCIDD